MKITLNNSNNFFTKKRIVLIIFIIIVYSLFLELFMQPYSKLVCQDNIYTMYSAKGRFGKELFEYSFNRFDISNYKLKRHKIYGGGPRYRTHTVITYSLILILSNNKMIHLPYYFGEQQAKDVYQNLKSNMDFVKFAPCYVYRFE